MNDHYASLVDTRRIVAVDSDMVPFPAGPLQREYLLVNCHYDTSLATAPGVQLLDWARSDAFEICRRLTADPRLHQCAAAVVTVYGHFPVSGAARPARRRIYRVTVPAQDLRTDRAISPSFLADIQAEESSELDDVAELLHQTAHLSPTHRLNL
jgi:hypothetical protein